MNIPEEAIQKIRCALATAIVQSGYEEADESDTAVELFEWHHCFDTPARGGNRTPPQPCACSGVPYLSEAVWAKVWPAIEGVAAPLIAAQELREAEDRIEWGVRWHGADVVRTLTGGVGLHDEHSARVTAKQFKNAEAVHRRTGPWIAAAGPTHVPG